MIIVDILDKDNPAVMLENNIHVVLCRSCEEDFTSDQYDVFYFVDLSGRQVSGCFLSEQTALEWADMMQYVCDSRIDRKLDRLDAG